MRRLKGRAWWFRSRVNVAVWLNAWWLLPRIAGGDTGKEGKEARRQEDVARQREEFRNQSNQLLAQLAPGSAEFQQAQELARLGEGDSAQRDAFFAQVPQLVQQQQARIAAGGPAGPLEARTNLAFKGFRDIGKRVPFEEDIFRILQGTAPETAFGKQIATGTRPTTIEQELLNALEGLPTTTPIGGVFRKPLSLAAAPTALPGAPVDDAVFRNALKLVEDRVNAEAAGRGILGGGLRLEQLGRAGTEASIAEALRQDQLRAEQNRLQQEAYQNAIGLFDTGRGIPIAYRDYFSQLFNVGEGLRQREIGLEGALVDLQLGRETNLTNLLNQNINTRLTDLNQLLQRRTEQSTTDRLDAMDAEAARKAGIGQAIGTGLAVAAAPFTGGASLLLAPSAGQLGGSLAGGGRTQTAPTGIPQTAGQLLAAQQTQPGGGGGQTFPSLSRQPGQQLSTEEFAELLRQISSGGSSSDFSSRLRQVDF